MRETEDVEKLLASYPPEIQRLALAARELVLQSLPKVEETVDFSARVIGYGFGPGYGGTVCTIIMSKAGVKLGFVRGAELPDPRGLLEGGGKIHRHVPLSKTGDLNRPGIKQMLASALAAWRRRTGGS